jgi:hypothetical protein
MVKQCDIAMNEAIDKRYNFCNGAIIAMNAIFCIFLILLFDYHSCDTDILYINVILMNSCINICLGFNDRYSVFYILVILSILLHGSAVLILKIITDNESDDSGKLNDDSDDLCDLYYASDASDASDNSDSSDNSDD